MPELTVANPSYARVVAALRDAAATLVPGEPPEIVLEAPRNAAFGDFASNVALQLAKRARRPPQQLAEAIVETIFATDPSLRQIVAEATAVAGFINVRLAPAYWQGVVGEILAQCARYGRGAPQGVRISLEFGSANPTGPLVVVQGRTLSLGDSLAKAMRFCGFDVETEWIVNDAGAQLEGLGRSLYARYRQIVEPTFAFPENGYPGDYLRTLAAKLRAEAGSVWNDRPEAAWLPFFAQYARDTLVAEQQATCARFRVSYDRWQSERVLHASGAVENGIAALRALGHVYEDDGAVWWRTTTFGDDKDRVIVRRDGRPTYVGADVAYHYDKLQRADRALLILGPDHHGYISRLEAIAAAFDRPGSIELLISQQMTTVRDGEVVSSSKRHGDVLTLDEILDEVGVDAARFFFVLPNPDSPMTFDLTLAKAQSSDNPVYYVQYGHARIASLERKASPELLARAERGEALERLTDPAEIALARRLSEFPATVRSVVDGRAPNRLARYAREVASDFHQFYMACLVLSDDDDLSVARLGLARATKCVLAQSLALLGVSAPASMERSPAE